MTQGSNRWLQTRSVSGDAYDATYERRAAAGENVHGEADLIESLGPASVLDAGCGTGRVGRELASRGMDVVGVDIDAEMLATARRTAPDTSWHLADLATVELARSFDAIVMAGNVMIFLAPGSERAVVENMARHLREDGLLVAGFQMAMLFANSEPASSNWPATTRTGEAGPAPSGSQVVVAVANL